MKVRLIIIAVLALVLTVLVPTSADAAGGDNWWERHCPSGYDGPDHQGNCTKTTVETFDAEKVINYHCPAGYSGPNKDNQCIMFDVEKFPATEQFEERCPDGWDGPLNGQCTRADTRVDTIHVTEVVTPVCPDGWVENSNGDCVFAYSSLVPAAVAVADNISCPDPIDIGGMTFEFVGPDANLECEASGFTPDIRDALAEIDFRCPNTFTLQGDNSCARDEVVSEFAGKIQGPLAIDCAPETPFDPMAGTCATVVPAKTTYDCLAGFTLDSTTVPPTCADASESGPVIYGLECPDPLTNLIEVMPGMGTCTLTTSPFDIIGFVCPNGFTEVMGGLSDMLCSREQTVTTVIDSIANARLVCDMLFAGPDENGKCIAQLPFSVIEPAIFTAEYFCEPGALGPDDNNECFKVVAETAVTPPFELLTFTCPDDYDGPDDDWNCTKTVDFIDTIDAEKVLTGYTCPGDARGPNRNDLCARDLVDTIDAEEKVRYVCPSDAHGAKDGLCTRRHTEHAPLGGHDTCYRSHWWGFWGGC